jgi:hypothetical protein
VFEIRATGVSLFLDADGARLVVVVVVMMVVVARTGSVIMIVVVVSWGVARETHPNEAISSRRTDTRLEDALTHEFNRARIHGTRIVIVTHHWHVCDLSIDTLIHRARIAVVDRWKWYMAAVSRRPWKTEIERACVEIAAILRGGVTAGLGVAGVHHAFVTAVTVHGLVGACASAGVASVVRACVLVVAIDARMDALATQTRVGGARIVVTAVSLLCVTLAVKLAGSIDIAEVVVLALVLLVLTHTILAPIGRGWDAVVAVRRHLCALAGVFVATIDHAPVFSNALRLREMFASDAGDAYVGRARVSVVAFHGD